ncbi:MAG: dihydroorotase [Spirochaetia bacterium]|nr:dihydroorotase [Spirochaetia bacterium]
MPAEEGKRITIRKPDDLHLHVRSGEIMRLVVPHTARQFARAVIMPNLVPPVRTLDEAVSYRKEILQCLDSSENFTPLMTLYLTGETKAEDIKHAKESGAVLGIKLYPSGATTNSQFGVSSIKDMKEVFAAMEKYEMPLMVHGEVVDPDVDVFDREKVFIERYFKWIVQSFPGLRVVLEHVTSEEGVSFVKSSSSNVAASITPHHMILTRNDLFSGGIRPHHYCLPVVKTEKDRKAIINAALSGDSHFFSGTDSAPHPASHKENSCGKAGIYTAWHALPLYAEVFDSGDSLENLEKFTSINGARFYRLPLNEGTITIEKSRQTVPAYFSYAEDKIIPLRAGGEISWQVSE